MSHGGGGARRAALAAALLALAGSAHAGRPLATDDASTNRAGVCQLEAWRDRAEDVRRTVLAPACGLTDTLELGAAASRASPRDGAARERGLSLKWVDPRAAALGWRFGLSHALVAARESEGRRARSSGTTLIASRALGEQAQAHVNLGHQRSHGRGQGATSYGLALVWTPLARALVFGEFTGDDRSAPLRTLGARLWLLPETLGLDLTWSRQAATPGSRVVGIGFGWYGIGL